MREIEEASSSILKHSQRVMACGMSEVAQNIRGKVSSCYSCRQFGLE